MERAERAALERSPDIRRAEAERRTAYAYRAFAAMPPVGNPLISARALIGRPDDPAATYSLMIGLPFQIGGRRRAYRHEARFLTAAADERLLAAGNDVRRAAREAYARVATAVALHELAGEAASTSRELADRVRARVQAGAANALDLTLAESQAAESEADLARARRSVVEAEEEFSRVLGLPQQRSLAVTPLPVPTMPDGFSIESAVETARRVRREPAIWAATSQRYHAAARRLRAEAIAPITVGLDAEQQANIAPNRSVGGSVSLELPVLQRNQGERAVATRQADAAELERELAEQAIDREVVAVHGRLGAALEELATLDGKALTAAERTLTMVHTLLESGAVDYFRLLTARANAFALRRRRIEVLHEAWLARITLDRAMGTLGSAP